MSLRILAICSAVLATAVPAGAQQFNQWLSPRNAYTIATDSRDQAPYYDAGRVAYDNGYRDGLKRGENAVHDRKAFDLEREGDYRDADNGYHRSYGNKDRYRDSYRSGFAEGYRSAFNRYGYNGGYSGGTHGRAVPRYDGTYRDPRYSTRYPTYGGNSGYYGYGANYAFQNGVNDGYQKGRDDARDGKYPDYARQKWYRSGDRHYDNHYGPKEVYKDQYRRGFRDGYERAYRELRRW
jgi:hypothetical protein